LFFKFRNLFGLDRKIDSVEIESILVLVVVRNTTGVVVHRIQTRQNSPHETFLVSVNNIGYRLFLFDVGWSSHIRRAAKGSVLADYQHEITDIVKVKVVASFVE